MSINLHILVQADGTQLYEVSLSRADTNSAASQLGFDSSDLSSRDIVRDFPLKLAESFIYSVLLQVDGAFRKELSNVAAYIRDRPNSLLTIGWW